jgi:hypothetical protein
LFDASSTWPYNRLLGQVIAAHELDSVALEK